MRVLPLSVVLVAVVVTLGVFTFARPEYRPPRGDGKVLRFDEATPPTNGWRWADPTPGFHLGEHGDAWNVSLLRADEVPLDAGVLLADRTDQVTRPQVIYWRDGCLGVQLHHGARQRLCDPRAAAVILADAPPSGSLFVIGAVRSDVTRVVAYAPRETYIDNRKHDHRVRHMPPQLLYSAKTPGWWGTFEYAATGGPVFVSVYGRHGRIATRRIDLVAPAERLYCASALRGVCGISAHRRS